MAYSLYIIILFQDHNIKYVLMVYKLYLLIYFKDNIVYTKII